MGSLCRMFFCSGARSGCRASWFLDVWGSRARVWVQDLLVWSRGLGFAGVRVPGVLGSRLGQFRHFQVLGFVEDAGLTCLGFRLQTAPTSNTTPVMNCSWVRAVPKVQRLKAWDSGFRGGGYKTSCTGHSDSRIWGKQSSLFRNKGVRLGILLVSKK